MLTSDYLHKWNSAVLTYLNVHSALFSTDVRIEIRSINQQHNSNCAADILAVTSSLTDMINHSLDGDHAQFILEEIQI